MNGRCVAGVGSLLLLTASVAFAGDLNRAATGVVDPNDTTNVATWDLFPPPAAEPAPAVNRPCALAAAFTPQPPSDEPNVVTRLAGEAFDETDVLHYDIDIDLEDDNKPFVVSVQIQVRSKVDGLSTFWFRLTDGMTIRSSTINETTTINVTRLTETTCIATLDRAYDKGEEFTVELAYDGTPCWTEYIPHTPWWMESDPYFAHCWLACKDGDYHSVGDNSDRAMVTLSVREKQNRGVIGPGVLVNSLDLGDGTKRVVWQTIYPRSVHHIFYRTHGLFNEPEYTTHYSSNVSEFDVKFYGGMGFAQAMGPNSVLQTLASFESAFGPYPHMAEGLAFNASGSLIFPHPAHVTSGLTQPEWVRHAIAHQWFGCWLIPKTWDETWLSEGFATYFEDPEVFLPQDNNNPTIDFYTYNVYLESNTGPWGVVWPYRDDVFEDGAKALRALRIVVGDQNFWLILRTFLAQYGGEAATTADFERVCNEVADEDLTWFFKLYVYQNLYDLLSVGYRYGYEGIEVDGRWYARTRVEQIIHPNDPEDVIFPAPLWLRVPQGQHLRQNFKVWNGHEVAYYVLPITREPRNLILDFYDWLKASSAEVAYQPGPPAIVHVDPAIGAFREPNAPVDAVEITFTDAVAVDPNDFMIIRRDGQPLNTAVTLDWLPDRQTARLAFDAPLADGEYSVTIHDAIEMNGFPLDGEIAGGYFPGALPSGDSQPGGDATYTFVVGPKPACLGDISGDGHVTSFDLALLLANHSQAGKFWSDGDLTGDGVVDDADVDMLLTEFGTTCD